MPIFTQTLGFITIMLKIIAESWNWIGINPVEIMTENEFGNVIIKDSNGSFWRIIPEDLQCIQIANNSEELRAVLSNPDFIEDWEMKNIVKLARASQGELTTGKKYHLVIPSPLGGKYSEENIRIVPFKEVIGVSGELAKQIKDLPDGAQVKLSVKNKS